jgi:hypothetical protein
MQENPCVWGDPRQKVNSEISSLASTARMGAEQFMVYGEGGFQSRTFTQYQEILMHNGAPNIFDGAKTIVDAGCGGATALAGMREEFGDGPTLIGFDMFDTRQIGIKRTGTEQVIKGQEILKAFDIQFIRGTYAQIQALIPNGYDALVAIPTFVKTDWESSYPLHILQEFYAGLHKGGRAQAILEIPHSHSARMVKCLNSNRIPFQFNPGDLYVLGAHALAPTDETVSMGTLTLGPKN